MLESRAIIYSFIEILNMNKVFLSLIIIASFIVFTSPRSLNLNAAYSLILLLSLVLVLRTKEPFKYDRYLICMIIYLIITTPYVALRTIEGKTSTTYFWLLGINTIFIIKFINHLSRSEQFQASRISFLSCFVYSLFIVDWNAVDLDSLTLIYGGSTNGLSAGLIFILCWYCHLSIISKREAPILLPLIMVIYSIILGGRSGIIFSFMIILLSIGFRGFTDKTKVIIFVSVLIIFFYNSLNDYTDAIMQGTRLRHGVSDDIRALMIKEYIENIDAMNIFSGQNYIRSGLIAEYGDNPHNSYIRAHSLFGIVPILFLILLFMISSACAVRKADGNLFYTLMLTIIILIRSFYDSVLVFFELDFIVIMMLLHPIIMYQKKQQIYK